MSAPYGHAGVKRGRAASWEGPVHPIAGHAALSEFEDARGAVISPRYTLAAPLLAQPFNDTGSTSALGKFSPPGRNHRGLLNRRASQAAAAASQAAGKGAWHDGLEAPRPARRALATFPDQLSRSRHALKILCAGPVLRGGARQ